jgi:hypothetical protein
VIGKIVLTLLVAAAKINQSSMVPAFDQTRVPPAFALFMRGQSDEATTYTSERVPKCSN